MDKELIEKIRCMLEYIEKYDDLLDEAKRNGDTEWENDLYAGLSHAKHDMKECVFLLFATNRTKSRQLQTKSLFDNKIRNKLA